MIPPFTSRAWQRYCAFAVRQASVMQCAGPAIVLGIAAICGVVWVHLHRALAFEIFHWTLAGLMTVAGIAVTYAGYRVVSRLREDRSAADVTPFEDPAADMPVDYWPASPETAEAGAEPADAVPATGWDRLDTGRLSARPRPGENFRCGDGCGRPAEGILVAGPDGTPAEVCRWCWSLRQDVTLRKPVPAADVPATVPNAEFEDIMRAEGLA
jgi:hypothetical protein